MNINSSFGGILKSFTDQTNMKTNSFYFVNIYIAGTVRWVDCVEFACSCAHIGFLWWLLFPSSDKKYTVYFRVIVRSNLSLLSLWGTCALSRMSPVFCPVTAGDGHQLPTIQKEKTGKMEEWMYLFILFCYCKKKD